MVAVRALKTTILALLIATLAGCATVGRDFPTHNVDQIRIGETTRADIQELFGEPWRTGVEDGKRTWTYGKYRWSAFGDAETTDLVVRFNEDGTVSSYVFNTTEYGVRMTGTGVVLTGGGARAAYQVGVLRAIADMYPDWEHPFRVIVGTSAGAINAMVIAGSRGWFRHGIDHLEKVWSELTMDHVFRADPISMMRNVTGIARRMLTRPAEGGPVSFLDNRPLRRLLEQEIDLERIHQTLSEGLIDAVGLNACGYASGRNICFFSGKEALEGWSQGQRAGTRTELTVDHIMASAAIPTLFPPVAINREYFGDGVTRQMAHISPALRLGAKKVLVIGVSANAIFPPRQAHQTATPSISQVLAQVFNGMFLDTLEYDIEHSRMINQLLALIPKKRLAEANLDLHPVDILEISPSESLDDLAAPHMGALPPLVRTLTGEAESAVNGGANLASYLLFDSHFCRELIELGYRDGQSHANRIQRFFQAD